VVTSRCVSEARAALGRIGAPYGQYLLDDVAAGKVHAKLYVFLNAWALSAKQRQQLREATRGSVCVWCYAPGYFDSSRGSLEAMQELTGLHVTILSNVKAFARPALGNFAGLSQSFGLPQSVSPLFAAAGHPEEVLCSYPDGGGAVAFHPSGDGRGASLFVGAPGLTTELLRFAAVRAGVHRYTETDCNVYASGPFVALHASQDGPITLDVGQSAAVTDALSGEPVGRGPSFSLSLHRGETRVLRIGQ
jgi:hypothetical protein